MLTQRGVMRRTGAYASVYGTPSNGVPLYSYRGGVPPTPSIDSATTRRFDETGRRGDMPSWSDLVAEHGDRVYRLAYRLCGNAHDAEDLTQETFIRVFRSIDRYQPGRFEGWVNRIVTNLFLDMVRRRGRIRFEALPEDADRVPGVQRGPQQVLEDEAFDPIVQRALDGLAPEFRAAVVLCDIEDLSYEEVGRILGLKLGTVRSRIHRGRAALRAELARAGIDERRDLAVR